MGQLGKSEKQTPVLSEIGDMNLGWGEDNQGPKSFEAALSNCETILRGMEVGVHAFNRWSFTNRGDLDGQWQLIRTWDLEKKEYFKEIAAEPVAYYGYGIITRFNAKNSNVVQTKMQGLTDILCQTIESPSGRMTSYILNKGNREVLAEILINGNSNDRLFLYQVTRQALDAENFKLIAVKSYKQNRKSFKVKLPPQSISVLSEFHLSENDMGIIED